jgi:hypothetical protein
MRTSAICIFFALLPVIAFSQENSNTIETRTNISLTEGASAILVKPEVVPDNIHNKRVISAGLEISLSAPDIDNYLSTISDGEKLDLTLTIAANGTGGVFDVFLQQEYTMSLSYSEYTCVLKKDFTRKLQGLVDKGYDISSLEITVGSLNGDVAGSSAFLDQVSLDARYYITYGYDIMLNANRYVSPPENLNVRLFGGRQAGFNWEHTFPFTAYEFQLLHFPNIAKGQYQLVSADWDKALKLLVPVEATDESNKLISQKKLQSLRLISGTGVYVWRVRAIGGFNDGGLGNSDNFGEWPLDLSTGSVNLTAETENTYWFYFEDSEENVNTIRSRVFTEDMRIKEISTYADGLQNVKQAQVNIPSNQTTIVTQTEQDFTGRNALASIPIPLGYETDVYEKRLLKNLEGELYTAEDFDDPQGSGATPPVAEDGVFSYYNNNQDKRIANTEGYPFSRTIYYNDGSNRVKEQSAPGNTFANKEDGSGHLIRYFYGTATETELVRLFGSEAPNPSNVSKTVVIDQNNVATTTYKTIDGHVIATCLNLAEDETGELLPVDNSSETASFTTTETVNANIRTDYGFYSSKRIVLPQATTLFLNYSITDASVKAMCASVTAGCQYQVELSVVDLSSNEIVFTSPATTISESNPVTGEVALPTGSYLVQKKLYSEGSGVSEEQLREKISLQVRTLFDVVEFWLTKAGCKSSGAEYYSCLEILSELSATQHLENLKTTLTDAGLDDFVFPETAVAWDASDGFVDMYTSADFPRDAYSVTFYQVSEEGVLGEVTGISLQTPADYMYIETGSCCDLWIPARYVETFDFNKEPEIYADGSVYPDFEAYAKEFMIGCTGSIYDYMDGWPEGTFNLMVYHMLTDAYDRSNPLIDEEEEDPVPVYDECGNLIDQTCLNGNCYDMRELFNCWVGVLTKLKEDLGCSTLEMEYDMEEDNTKFDEAIDEDNGDDGSTQDDHYDDNFKMKGLKGWIAKKIAKRRISKRIRSMSTDVGPVEVEEAPNVSTMHLVKEFLECTGYQFGKIITPNDPYPLGDDVQSDFEYYYMANLPALGYYPVLRLADNINDYLANYRDLQKDYPYIPISGWDPKKKSLNDDDEPYVPANAKSLFPSIQNPIYAFKYFTYNGHALADFAVLEQTTCFDDPNDCFLMEDSAPVIDPENGGIEWIPACVKVSLPLQNTDIENADYSFCYKDFGYPLLETMSVAEANADYRFGVDASTGKIFRWVVDEFVGKGRLRCPYTHEVWSSGQRYTFYNMLKNYSWDAEEAQQEKVFSETCDKVFPAIENPNWYESNSGGLIRQEIVDAAPELLDSYSQVTDYTPYYYPGAETDGGEARTNSVSRLELEMSQLVKSCTTSCDNKRNEVHRMVLTVLRENGYNIGGCISAETPENIPEEDVEEIVDALQGQCKSQCVVTTFSCEDVNEARLPYASKRIPGPSDNIDEYAIISLGISTTSDAVCDLPELSGYADCSGGVTRSPVYFLSGNTGPAVYQVNLGTTETQEMSWYEYTLIKQAIEWRLKISIEPVGGLGLEREFECTGGNTTFVDKNQYEIPPVLPDGTKPGNTDVDVKSPAKALDITISGE